MSLFELLGQSLRITKRTQTVFAARSRSYIGTRRNSRTRAGACERIDGGKAITRGTHTVLSLRSVFKSRRIVRVLTWNSWLNSFTVCPWRRYISAIKIRHWRCTGVDASIVRPAFYSRLSILSPLQVSRRYTIDVQFAVIPSWFPSGPGKGDRSGVDSTSVYCPIDAPIRRGVGDTEVTFLPNCHDPMCRKKSYTNTKIDKYS